MSSASVGSRLALAVAAGALVAAADADLKAIADRRDALKRAIKRRSKAIDFDAVDRDPASSEARDELARALDDQGADKDREVVTTAKELLGLIKVDETARAAVGTLLDEVEAALIALAEVDVETVEAPPPEPSARTSGASGTPSAPVAPTTSRRGLFEPPAEHSKTELEREALPIWQRTENFFTKALILVAIVASGAIAWCALGPSPTAALDACRKGGRARCWQAVTEADAIDQGRAMPDEPLRLLCDREQDACACAGLAYLTAARSPSGGAPDCNGLRAASTLDSRWPCTCQRYEFWHAGELQLSSCGIPRCE